MPVQIQVGPPVLSINQGNTFMVTDLNGEIAADSELGLFSEDTRFINHYQYFLNGRRWNRLSAAATNYFSSIVVSTNEEIATDDFVVPRGQLAFTILRELGNGLNEELQIQNHSERRLNFILEVALRCDFADIFEVRWRNIIRRGSIETWWDAEARELSNLYTHEGFERRMVYRVLRCPSPVHYGNGRISYRINLAPGEMWSSVTRLELVTKPAGKCRTDAVADALTMRQLHKRWTESATKLVSSNEEIYRLYRQSVDDLGGLRLYKEEYLSPQNWIPAAGVPWYVTIFGRDSLMIGIQSMFVHEGLSLGALSSLAGMQATERDDYRDAQPGKIAHEIRFGELAYRKRIPHTPYYGSWDSTTLYLVALHEAWKWTGTDAVLKEYRETALRCLEWIDRYGDIDNDGFHEYQTYSDHGYENMGWKDAEDAIVYPDGTQVEQPKALCELQGYLFDAWMRCAELFDHLGETTTAQQLRQKAKLLRERFEAQFWIEDEQFYALTLDKDKRPVGTIASNIAHCMWSGLIDEKRAAKVVARLFKSDMWSGWGLRTLSNNNPHFNPHSYHCGSVWPHDNGIFALGLKRYGFVEEAAKVARAISDAASFFVSHRLPELYAGIQRTTDNFPVQYDGANVPQGWTAGSVFHLLQAMLGIRADAPHGVLYVDPALPHWLEHIKLSGIKCGGATIDLEFELKNGVNHWRADTNGCAAVEVKQERWAPW